MKTIKQIADTLGVSKTAVRKRLTADFKAKHTETANGVILISQDGVTLIAQSFLQSPQTLVSGDSANGLRKVPEEVSGAFAVLQEQLRVKDEQISELHSQLHTKDEQIKFLQDNAAAAQALHAGTIQKQLTDGGSSEESSAAATVVTAPGTGFFARLTWAIKGK